MDIVYLVMIETVTGYDIGGVFKTQKGAQKFTAEYWKNQKEKSTGIPLSRAKIIATSLE